MNLLKNIGNFKIHREGVNILIYLALFLLLTNTLRYFFAGKMCFYIVLPISIYFYILIIRFFRNPYRHFNEENADGLIVAPADGRIVAIEEVVENEYFQDKRLLISIFMSVTNVHANWYPVSGKVIHTKYHKGLFLVAYLPKSSTDNERSTIVLETEKGTQILVRQIAGTVARRIVTYSKPGETCNINQQLGFIKFGSRVDVYLPPGSEVLVQMNQQVTGCQTVIAKLNK